MGECRSPQHEGRSAAGLTRTGPGEGLEGCSLAVAAKRGGKIIDRRSLKVARTWYRNTFYRHIMEPLDLQAHALRYAYACDLLDLYQQEGFSRAECEAQTSMDLGHGDGRGRYVRQVYGRISSVNAPYADFRLAVRRGDEAVLGLAAEEAAAAETTCSGKDAMTRLPRLA
jgi:hypothetical protein